MIIYGWNTSNLKQAQLGESYECPDCHHRNSVLAVFASYVHIFWIPLFPYKKRAQIICMNCDRADEDKYMESEIKQKVRQLKKSVKTPWWMFSGAGIVIILITFSVVSGFLDGQEQAAMASSPEIGDVYVIHDQEETSEYNHYLMKVVSVAEDSLYVTVTSYSYNGVVDRLDPKDGFYNLSFGLHKDEIVRQDKSGELKQIYRGYSSIAGFDREVAYEVPEAIKVE
ncbi:MAG: hypothetical protein R8G66_08745 [Cytophagales bacterium]|nr:hypothetical protein [Cytophagales bacterium]